MSIAEIYRILGNGDFTRGQLLVQDMAKMVIHARNSHKWGIDGECNSAFIAHEALYEENCEWYHAVLQETPERQRSEILDVLAVAIRMANEEYKQG